MSDPAVPAPALDWLSLGPASRLLGVGADTLRRWADEGRVEAFVTPGGHRRFARRSVERLAASRHRRPAGIATLGATPDRLARAYRRSYASSADGSRPIHQEQDREAFRHDGRRLVEALIRYLDAAGPRQRQRAEAAAEAATDDLAAHLASSGTGVAESVGLFVAARRPFFAELGAIARRRALDPARVAGLYEEASAVLDRLLVRLVNTAVDATPRSR